MGRNPLYKRSRWTREIDQLKTEIGVHTGYLQDNLDYSLLKAVRENNNPAIREMVSLGANLNMFLKPKNGRTICSLLHIAAVDADIKTIDTLLQLGADPKLLDSNGLIAKDYGILKKRPGRILTMLTKWEQKITSPVNDDNRSAKILEINRSPFCMKKK